MNSMAHRPFRDMDYLKRLDLNLKQLREELGRQRQWGARTRQRAQELRAELVQVYALSNQLIETSRRKLAELRAKDQPCLP
jgi:hypothetical protein